jgi:hypothetical protein
MTSLDMLTIGVIALLLILLVRISYALTREILEQHQPRQGFAGVRLATDSQELRREER